MSQSFQVSISTNTHLNSYPLFECLRDCDIAVAMWHSLTSRVLPAYRYAHAILLNLARSSHITDAMIALHTVEEFVVKIYSIAQDSTQSGVSMLAAAV
jgi:hypothetical protein